MQLSGRTGGDLITVFDVPDGLTPGDLIGTIVTVRVTEAGPLILKGHCPAPLAGPGEQGCHATRAASPATSGAPGNGAAG